MTCTNFRHESLGLRRSWQREVEIRWRLYPQIRWKSQTALHHPRLDVVDEVLHHFPAIARLEAHRESEAVAGSAGPTKRGKRKAELLAGAKALIFPTRVDEAFGLGMVEALMSGTPVICSDRGACPEIITGDVGFVCRYEPDYVNAIRRVGEISPQTCREKAMRDFHYLRMAKDYLAEYEKEIATNGT